jgi:hypothetical protein
MHFTGYARFALIKLMADENRDVGARNILEYPACLSEVVRVEMTGT